MQDLGFGRKLVNIKGENLVYAENKPIDFSQINKWKRNNSNETELKRAKQMLQDLEKTKNYG